MVASDKRFRHAPRIVAAHWEALRLHKPKEQFQMSRKPHETDSMRIVYACDNEGPAVMTLGELIANFDMTGGWYDRMSAEHMRDELTSRGWCQGLHENGHYLVMNCRALKIEPHPVLEDEAFARKQAKPESYADILAALASNNGACLYWQMPNVKRAQTALAAGMIKQDGDLLVHPNANKVADGSYTMRQSTFHDWFNSVTANAFATDAGSYMKENGYSVEHTGGGCLAWSKGETDSVWEVWITDNDAGLGIDLGNEFQRAREFGAMLTHKDDGAFIEGPNGATIAECIDWGDIALSDPDAALKAFQDKCNHRDSGRGVCVHCGKAL